ncbi:MAG TPA: RNA-binding protein [Synechococcales cyanobacterium M55_K2018_004]|nr:RNA-binding protein [Synechococcales cyanobacterium M55_K2018_004]
MSIRLYVGNLPKELERQELAALFSEFDESVTTKIITDRKTGKCRGFGFVTVKTDEQADQFIEKFNNYLYQDTPLKIEKALPRTKGKGEDGEEGSVEAAAPSGNSNSGKRSKGNKSKQKSASTESESVQPDPRWAQELEKLKQLLSAQTANS